MKKHKFIFVFFTMSTSSGQAQKEQTWYFNKMPLEHIFMHEINNCLTGYCHSMFLKPLTVTAVICDIIFSN